MSDLNIIGWGPIVPQLAAFFSVLKRRPNGLTPFNLFVSGLPGTNKSEGLRALVRHLGYTVALVDSATLDDVAELAGTPDLKANREEGVARLIEGDLLKQEVLILDEPLNARPHVLPQLRLFLQGLLVLQGMKVPMNTRAVISAANLSEDMLAGEANTFDSPTADRFALIVKAPSMWEMTPEEQEAILEGDSSDGFAVELARAMKGIEEQWIVTEEELGTHATRYVRSLGTAVIGTQFAFEGRRGKLLRQFIIAVLALCRAESTYELEKTIWAVVHDCLSYHKLAGVELDNTDLKAKHLEAFAVLKETGIASLIAQEPTLPGKIRLMTRHLTELANITKADVLGQVMTSPDLALQLATIELVRSATFAGQPAELKAMIERIQLPFPSKGVKMGAQALNILSQMNAFEVQAFELCNGDEKRTNALLEQVHSYLSQWGVR